MYPSNLKKMMLAVEDSLSEAGAALVDCEIVQPAEPFLNMAGEDIRRRIFMTQNVNGISNCLRPEFTIPVCFDHIKNDQSDPKKYGYIGPVFRQRPSGKTEFYQAGIENLGDTDIARADAMAISDALNITIKHSAGSDIITILGDQNIFTSVLQALGLPEEWQQRLKHAFGNEQALGQMLNALRDSTGVVDLGDELAAILEAENHEGLVEHLADTMQATGYSTHASRSPDEIAKRLIEKQRLAKATLSDDQFDLLQKFLKLELLINDAVAALNELANDADIDISSAISLFEQRLSALEETGIDLAQITYKGGFGRSLDYYTGLVFEVSKKTGGEVLAAGGRYDQLMSLLGASRVTPAVGFALWLDRFGDA